MDKVSSLSGVLTRLTADSHIQILIITHKQDIIVGEGSGCETKQHCKQIIGTYYCNNNTHIITALN